MKTDEYSCEVWFGDAWVVVPIETAIAHPELTRRCPECHGKVKAMRAGPENKPRAHPEHYSRHKGCSLGDCFDGKNTLHSNPVLDPKKEGSPSLHIPEEIVTPSVFTEGASVTVSLNAYERNPKARKICLKHYGYSCVICSFNFEKRYGKNGKGIIHVHHLVPLSKVKRSYEVDPIKDLRPVCPNCHAFIHSKAFPYSIDEAKVHLVSPT